MTKRKSLIICLVVAFALSLLMAITCLMPQSAALADGEDFAVKGASLRYTTTAQENGENDDGTGLRFVLNAKQTYIDAAEEIGLLLIPADMLEEGEELTVETEDAIKNPKGNSDWTVDGDYMSTYFYLWNIPETDCDREVVARGYAKVGGSYVYTTDEERSFESVAIAAIAGSANTQEDKDMCAALSKYVVTDPGNVAYIGTDKAVNMSIGYEVWANPVPNYTFQGENVYRIGWTSTGWLQFLVKAPAIKDFTAYDYFYTDLYIEGTGDYNVNFGVIWANEIVIPANQWTRIVFAKDSNGVFKTTEGKTLMPDGVSSNFVSSLKVSFSDADKTSSTSVYIREMRLTNAVPSLNIKLGDVVEGDTVTIADTYEVVNAENATVNVKVSVAGAAATAITDETYTFNKKGAYTFIYDLIVDGKTVTYSKTVKATVKTYTIVDFTDPDVESLYESDGGWASNGDGKSQNSKGVVTHPNGTSSFYQILCETYGGVKIKAPAITDLSSYNYAFIDVYLSDNDGSFTFNNVWAYNPSLSVEKRVWTRIVIVNDGTGKFTMPNASANAELPVFENSASVGEYSMFVQANSWCYLGKFVACNELPELPSGMAANYTPAA